MPGSMGGGEPSERASGLVGSMSTGDLHHQIDVLMNKEKIPSARTKLLITLASACGSCAANLRCFTEALTMCWEEQRYSGTEALEWRTSIIQAAGNTVGAVQEVTESFVSLGVKVSTWCTEIVAADSRGRISEREARAGLSKLQATALELLTLIFEGMVEKYSLTKLLLPEEPLASLTETLISSSFAFVKVVYISSMNNPSLQFSDNESMMKSCDKLLNLASRLVYTFRRHVGSHPLDHRGLTESGKNKELNCSERWQQQAISLRIVASSIKSLAELGDLSTRGGATSLGLLNVSWKSVAALLQLEQGRDVLASAVDIAHILTSLLHHALQTLKVAVMSWLSSPSSGVKDARRLCIPVKFFLQMAEKISAFYPQKAITASTSIVLCVSKVLACLLLQYKDPDVRKTELQVLAEFVIPSVLDVLHNLLSARTVEEEAKVHLLELITCDSDDLWSSHSVTDWDGGQEYNEVLEELFNDKPNGLGLLKTGRLALFISLLQLSGQYSVSLQSHITLKLHWLLEGILEEGVYVLLTQAMLLPVWTEDGKVAWNYHLMFTWILEALQTFAGVTSKDESVWTELQYFLFENVLHPCGLCREVILNLWCFIIRRSDSGSAQTHMELLFSLLQDMVSAKMDVTVQRRLARVLCALLEEIPEAEAERVYASVFHQDPFSSEITANLATVLLEEGYSFSPLSDGTRRESMDRFLSSCIAGGKSLVDCLKLERSFSNFALQKQTLCCLQILLCESAFRGEEIEDKYLQEILVIVQEVLSRTIQDAITSPNCQNDEILSHALQLIPHVQHLLSPSFIHTLLPGLQECCSLIAQHTSGKELKQTLPEFLANLSEIAMTEEEENPAMKALWYLYHLALKEKHWVLVHMGLASFSHFAAHTSCQELWRFVPEDATLTLKTTSDTTTNDVFMRALKSYIEKDSSQNCLAPSDEELGLLRSEGARLQKNRREVSGMVIYGDVERMDIDQTSRGMVDIEEAFDLTRKNIHDLRFKILTRLNARCRGSHEWQIIRSRLVDLKDEWETLQNVHQGFEEA